MANPGSSIGEQLADTLNRDCHRISVNKDALQNSLWPACINWSSLNVSLRGAKRVPVV